MGDANVATTRGASVPLWTAMLPTSPFKGSTATIPPRRTASRPAMSPPYIAERLRLRQSLPTPARLCRVFPVPRPTPRALLWENPPRGALSPLPLRAARRRLVPRPLMRVLLLNGSLAPDPLLDELAARITQSFAHRQATVETVLLRIEEIAWCQGCFECWTTTPGLCKINDAGRDLAREFVQADAVVLLTPSRFGGLSSEIKKLLDRTIGMLLPFFRNVGGETHHPPRYEHRPALGVFGVLDHADFDEETTLRVLADRIAVNVSAPVHHTEVIARHSPPGVSLVACDALVEALCATPATARERIKHPDALLPAMARMESGTPPQRALVLVGSAKPRGTSTSEALGMELMERLAMHGVRGDLRHVHRDANDDDALAALVSAVREIDLLVLATPVYMDALPWLLTRALEAIASVRQTAASPRPLTVTMIANTGFPEARHASVCRTMGALFARDAHAYWAGALQLGGGAMMGGRALDGLNPLLKRLAPLLDDAATSLARGERLTDVAVQGFQEPLLPPLAYVAAADAGWLWTAAHAGAVTRLWERPAESNPA